MSEGGGWTPNPPSTAAPLCILEEVPSFPLLLLSLGHLKGKKVQSFQLQVTSKVFQLLALFTFHIKVKFAD